jgi:hypothetical protein
MGKSRQIGHVRRVRIQWRMVDMCCAFACHVEYRLFCKSLYVLKYRLFCKSLYAVCSEVQAVLQISELRQPNGGVLCMTSDADCPCAIDVVQCL